MLKNKNNPTSVVHAKAEGETLINIASVMQKTGFGRSFLYGEISENRFPVAIKIGPKASRWVLSEIEQWIADRVADRNVGKQ